MEPKHPPRGDESVVPASDGGEGDAATFSCFQPSGSLPWFWCVWFASFPGKPYDKRRVPEQDPDAYGFAWTKPEAILHAAEAAPGALPLMAKAARAHYRKLMGGLAGLGIRREWRWGALELLDFGRASALRARNSNKPPSEVRTASDDADMEDLRQFSARDLRTALLARVCPHPVAASGTTASDSTV
jgi:hypothetical protein